MIFVSDWHLGLETDSILIEGVPSKVRDSIVRIRELIKYAAKTHQIIVVAGDINETVNPKSYVHAALVGVLDYASQRGVSIYFIPGNHDCDINWTSLLVGKSAYKHSGLIQFILKPTVLKLEEKKVCFIPHIPRGNIKGYETYLGMVREEVCSKADIVVSHALAKSALNISDSVLAESNNALPFNKDLFPKSPLYILGHVHNHQIITIGNSKVVYPGSITMNDFGERHDKKGFVVLNEKADIKFIPFHSRVHDYAQVNLNLVGKARLELQDSKLLKVKDKILKIVVRTDNYDKVDELYIKSKFAKYSFVARFETIHEGSSITTKLVMPKATPNAKLLHTKLLKKWLDGQEEESDSTKQLAYRLGKKIVEEE